MLVNDGCWFGSTSVELFLVFLFGVESWLVLLFSCLCPFESCQLYFNFTSCFIFSVFLFSFTSSAFHLPGRLHLRLTCPLVYILSCLCLPPFWSVICITGSFWSCLVLVQAQFFCFCLSFVLYCFRLLCPTAFFVFSLKHIVCYSRFPHLLHLGHSASLIG